MNYSNSVAIQIFQVCNGQAVQISETGTAGFLTSFWS